VAWGAGNTESSCGQGFGDCLKRHCWEAKSQAEQTGHGTAQGMPSQPDICVGVDLSDVRVEIDGSSIIFVLIVHRLHDASHVSGKKGALAVTDLPPKIRTSLATATTEEQVVIGLVIRRGASSIKHSRRSALQGNHNGAIGFVGIDMSSKSVLLPSKAVGVVESAVDGLPILCAGLLDIIIGRHLCKRQHRLLVRDIWAHECIHNPVRWR
jgi:hypothetical protein